MKEGNSIILLCAFLLLIGVAFYCITEINNTEFTFKSASISSADINDNHITESLNYEPKSRAFHTLYRNFLTPIRTSNVLEIDNIVILDVKCSAGTPYYKDYSGAFYSGYSKSDIGYTENNEYGCGFGADIGFGRGKQYQIAATYALNAKSLTEFDGKHYIKFIAYSKYTHPMLITGKNFIVPSGSVTESTYLPSEDVILYIPYEPAHLEDYNILNAARFDFGNIILLRLIKIMILLLPIIICYAVWRRFGKEHIEGDYPEELSQYPKERKPWQVNAYFTPPFGMTDHNFNSTMLMDFYNRKIIDIKTVDKTSRIKILKEPSGLDDVEKAFLDLLKKAHHLSGSKDEYFDLSEINKDQSKALELWNKQLSIQKKVREKGKEYHDKKGIAVLLLSMIPILILIAVVFKYGIVYDLIALISLIIIASASALFLKFNKEYYPEYQQWRGFRQYLLTLDSMKRSPPQGTILWEKYLVYATALGVGRKVLDALKKWKIINDKTYNHYNTVYATPIIFANPSSGSGAGGMGGGGFSGGGIGGGGGGGR